MAAGRPEAVLWVAAQKVEPAAGAVEQGFAPVEKMAEVSASPEH